MNERYNGHYKIDIFDPSTGFIHVANVTEIIGVSHVRIKDQLRGTIQVGNIKGKHLPDRNGPEAKGYFVELRKIAGIKPNPQ